MRKFNFLVQFCAVSGAFLCIAPPATGDIYRYVDPDGITHFTNTPNMPGYRLFMKETKSRRTLEQERVRTFDPLIHEAAKRHGVDKPLVLAVVKVESDFDPAAVSCKGAQGLMQLMPETARLLGVKDCFDPKDNIEGGVKHLRSLLDKFEGRLSLALAAYNAGKDAVLEYGGIPPFPETKGYVEKVIQYYNFYKSDGGR